MSAFLPELVRTAPRPALRPGRVSSIATVVLLATAAGAAEPPADSVPAVDFARDVRPILSARCFACHGPDVQARKAGLSLLDFDSATAELAPGVAAIVPGDLEASEMWLRITDELDPMPPSDGHDPLSPSEIETIRRWIESGASFRPHWAYEAPVEARIESRIDDTDRDPVDVLLERRHDELGLFRSPPADDLALLRRLHLDLTGLQPSPAETDAFLASTAPDRWEAEVDRLLATPHFGERLAVHWLDLVRYADTVGYHGDQEHRIWPFRDWVISAFNDGMPFDRFTRMQLAGDILADELPPGRGDDAQAARVASGYNRLVQTSHEGGLQLKEYRAIYMADRVRNVSEVWMGATVGCAQCHDHKYDPYTHRDYHALGAFFADIDDEAHLRNPYDGYNTTPTRREPEMQVVTSDRRRLLDALEGRREAAGEALARARADVPPPDEAWETGIREAIARGDGRSETWVDDTLDTGGRSSGDWTFRSDPGIAPAIGNAYRLQRSDGLVQHYTVETERRIEIEPDSTIHAWLHLDPTDLPKAIMIQVHAGGSWEHRMLWGDDSIPYGRTDVDRPSYRRAGPLPDAGRWIEVEVPLAQVGLEPGATIDGMAFTQFGGTVRWDAATIVHPTVAPPAVMAALAIGPADRSSDDHRTLVAHRVASDPAVIAAGRHLERLESERKRLMATLPLTMITERLERPRTVRILPRGDWLDESGEIVLPAAPAFMGTVTRRADAAERADRLDLANWLLAPIAEGGVGELTARVFVNRLWSILFGEGLCPSEEDFGGQGRPPTHPEALDRLALDFMASGWDVKAMVRRLVLTDAYRRSSVPPPGAVEIDPGNLEFARQARHRLPAEFVRDVALQAGGRLVDRRGGPSVKPPQPEGYYRHLNFPPRSYRPDMGDDARRRGVYVHWQRQFLHPMLRAFDAPTRESCTAQRTISNTPLAALVLLNDPVFLDAARGLARTTAGIEDDRDRLVHAWRRAVVRPPSESEVAVLERLLAESRRSFASDPGRAAALSGEAPDPANPEDVVELAAWTQVARALLNLHETYTRE